MSIALAKYLKSALKKEASKYAHKHGGKCRTCNAVLKKSTCGWGLCANHFRKARRRLLKEVLISYKGGACSRCGGVYHSASFDFHHPGGKTENPSQLLREMSIDRVAAELESCELICSNCHREHHYRENNLV